MQIVKEKDERNDWRWRFEWLSAKHCDLLRIFVNTVCWEKLKAILMKLKMSLEGFGALGLGLELWKSWENFVRIITGRFTWSFSLLHLLPPQTYYFNAEVISIRSKSSIEVTDNDLCEWRRHLHFSRVRPSFSGMLNQLWSLLRVC